MEPYGAMCTHNDHAIYNECNQKWYRKIAENKQKEKREHANCH